MARAIIRIDPDQTDAQYRCTLEHEWVHWLHGDVPTGDWSCDAKMERAVDSEVALRLIALDDLMDALAWAHCLDEAAELLNVDRATLDARVALLGDEDRHLIDEKARAQERGIA